MKSQVVRLLDVFLFGPFMIWQSRQKKIGETESVLLLLLGAGTIVYNGKNYLELLETEGPI